MHRALWARGTDVIITKNNNITGNKIITSIYFTSIYNTGTINIINNNTNKTAAPGPKGPRWAHHLTGGAGPPAA